MGFRQDARARVALAHTASSGFEKEKQGEGDVEAAEKQISGGGLITQGVDWRISDLSL
jgi:hypothetical protein